MRFLAANEDARHWLARQPTAPLAVDELFRYHGVVSDARLVMKDLTFRGISMRAGEQILLPTALVGLDEERFENPGEVRFHRPNAGQNGTFGNGVHRCVGANLARMELKVVLEEWLKIIPDFHLIENDPPRLAAGILGRVLRVRRWHEGRQSSEARGDRVPASSDR